MHPINLIRDAVSAAVRRGELKLHTAAQTQNPIDPSNLREVVWSEDPRDPQFFRYPATTSVVGTAGS